MFTKANTIKTLAVMFLTVATIGLFNLDMLADWIGYINDHTNGYMRIVYYSFFGVSLCLSALLAGLSMEYPLWESGDKIGLEVSTLVYNARNSWIALGAFCLFGGMVNLAFVVGCCTLIG